MAGFGLPDRGFSSRDEARIVLRQIFAEAMAGVRGDELIGRRSRLDGGAWIVDAPGGPISWDLPDDGRIFVIGAGKAVASLAKGLEGQLGERIHAGCVIAKYGHTEDLRRIRQIEAGHPVPDENGLAATRQMLDLLQGLTPADRVFVLLTGGASALMVAPVEGITLADKAAVTALLLRSNAPIEEINWVRRALSRVKGGRLLGHIAPAQSMTLVISDVPGDDLGLIGSGPTIPAARQGGCAKDILAGHGLLDAVPPSVARLLDPVQATKPPPESSPAVAPRSEAVILANCHTVVHAIGPIAERLGIPIELVDAGMRGNTHRAAERFVAAMTAHAARPAHGPRLFVSTGETTLRVDGSGLGGRNQEFALIGAMGLAGTDRCVLLASGTDGTDGPTDAAGAFADGTTCARVIDAGLDIERTLANNDSYNLFRAIGDLHITGPTGTNVMDLVLGLVL